MNEKDYALFCLMWYVCGGSTQSSLFSRQGKRILTKGTHTDPQETCKNGKERNLRRQSECSFTFLWVETGD